MSAVLLAVALVSTQSCATSASTQADSALGDLRFDAAAVVERSLGRAFQTIATDLARLVGGSSAADGGEPAAAVDPDDSSDDEIVLHPPVPPKAPGRRDGPWGGLPGGLIEAGAEDQPLPPFTEKGHGVPTVQVLHRLARAAGWSLTLVGVGKETIDVDFNAVDPREALREVLRAGRCLGVLRGDKLVVLPSSASGQAGMLMFQRHPGHPSPRRRERRSGNDVVKVFQGDLTVPAGTVLHGDAVSVGGSIEVEPGGVVEGNAVSVLGSLHVEQGGVVLGDGVAVLGSMDVERGGQVLGEHVQVGIGSVLGGRRRGGHSFLSRLGPLGLFPTLAIFALIYLCGLLALRAWPDRLRAAGAAVAAAPVRSFLIGFLCWLMLPPLAVLLCISIIGIPLVLLLPLALFLAASFGISALALRLGELLPAPPGQRFIPPAALGLGVLLLLLVSFVPLLGISLLALVQFFALGGAVGSRFGRPGGSPS